MTVTVWCDTCGGPSTIVQEGVEEDFYGKQWWVTLLDCGHQLVEERGSRTGP